MIVFDAQLVCSRSDGPADLSATCQQIVCPKQVTQGSLLQTIHSFSLSFLLSFINPLFCLGSLTAFGLSPWQRVHLHAKKLKKSLSNFFDLFYQEKKANLQWLFTC